MFCVGITYCASCYTHIYLSKIEADKLIILYHNVGVKLTHLSKICGNICMLKMNAITDALLHQNSR